MEARRIIALISLTSSLVLAAASAVAAEDAVSAPGKYSGYSPVLYDGVVRTSQYVTVRDGTRIAVDIIRPALNGQPAPGKFPVVWTNTPLNRRGNSATSNLVKYGYVVAAADMRGNYASYGIAVNTNRAEWMQAPQQAAASWDAYDITEWFAAQPWASGNVGMYGCSAVGHSTFQAAATAPPHLKAIFPMAAAPEYYDWGGVTAMFADPPAPPNYPSTEPPAADARAVPVDGDTDGALLAAAKDGHRYNVSGPGFTPYRDSVAPWLESLLGVRVQWWNQQNILPYFDAIQKSRVAIYQTVSMEGDDMRTKLGNVVKLNNLSNPIKSLFSPGSHCRYWDGNGTAVYPYTFNLVAEQLRYFDYWLKGVNNGITDEPPIYYYMYNAASPERDYRFAWQWPVPSEARINYYLAAGASGTVAAGASNGGALVTQKPGKARGSQFDRYTVDYSAVSAKSGQIGDNSNATGMTYTTAALASGTKLIGSPIIHLWISSTATDGDFIANLWDVAADGTATKIPGSFNGMLRASHRRLGKAPYAKDLGLPYHRSYAEDIAPLTPGEPTDLVFDEAPLAYTFRAGHRIRLVIICNGSKQDGDQFPNPPTPVLSPAPIVNFYRDLAHPSYITLPVNTSVPASAQVKQGKSASEILAYIAFPATMDVRYLRDIKNETVTLNGVAADRVEPDGNRLVAVFSGSALAASFKRGDPMSIEGMFGKKYYYGEEMSFKDTVKPRPLGMKPD